MSGEEPVVVVAAEAPVLGEPMDIMTALQLVLKKSLAHGGLVRGLHEGAKAIEKNAAQLCVLAEDCDQTDYVKLVKALCAEHNVNLITISSAKTLGEWTGLCKIDTEGKARKVVGASCVVVKDVGESGPVYSSSHTLPEMDGVKDHGEELVGCRVKVWRPKSNTFSEGVVSSYDQLLKKHLVENAQTQKARDSSSVHADNDMDANGHVGKKHKGESFNHTTPAASPISSKDLRKPKLESDLEPMDSKLSSVSGDDCLVNINGYKIKSTSAQTLESIFAKYGDIMAHCVCKSKFVRASLLEVICSIVQRLQYHDIETILSELEDIENEVSDLKASKIKVSWLREHLAKLRKIVGFKEGSFELRKTKAKSGFVTKAVGKELKQRHAELVLAQERFKEADKRVNAMRLVGRKIDDIMEYESEEYFWKRRLDDLI